MELDEYERFDLLMAQAKELCSMTDEEFEERITANPDSIKARLTRVENILRRLINALKFDCSL